MNALEKFASMSGTESYIYFRKKNQDESRLGSDVSLKVRFRLTLHCKLSFLLHNAIVHKKSKNLKNGHFLQSRTKIVRIEIKFAKF